MHTPVGVIFLCVPYLRIIESPERDKTSAEQELTLRTEVAIEKANPKIGIDEQGSRFENRPSRIRAVSAIGITLYPVEQDNKKADKCSYCSYYDEHNQYCFIHC